MVNLPNRAVLLVGWSLKLAWAVLLKVADPTRPRALVDLPRPLRIDFRSGDPAGRVFASLISRLRSDAVRVLDIGLISNRYPLAPIDRIPRNDKNPPRPTKGAGGHSASDRSILASSLTILTLTGNVDSASIDKPAQTGGRASHHPFYSLRCRTVKRLSSSLSRKQQFLDLSNPYRVYRQTRLVGCRYRYRTRCEDILSPRLQSIADVPTDRQKPTQCLLGY
jgi:hypothetical protein